MCDKKTGEIKLIDFGLADNLLVEEKKRAALLEWQKIEIASLMKGLRENQDSDSSSSSQEARERSKSRSRDREEGQ